MRDHGFFVRGACIGALALSGGVHAGVPSIEITSVPPYAGGDAEGFVHGVVSGVDFAAHAVATYIQIEGGGWWTKPTFEIPTVPIAPDGTFVVDVVTGGLDNRATIFFVALIPAIEDPPPAAGAPGVPPSLGADALATDFVERYGRTIEFAGFTWGVKEAPLPVGPGANVFSLDESDVFVDGAGHLHLTVQFHDGAWWATEVILLESPGFGTYTFKTNSRLDVLDVYVTFAGFTWDAFGDVTLPGSPHREIDFEDSRWGNPDDPANAQFVVQPFTEIGNVHRYTIPDLSGDARLTRSLTWSPCRVEFLALLGDQDPFDFPPEALIATWTYHHKPALQHFVPDEGDARFRFNLWINHPGAAPHDGEPVEVIITDFGFVAGEPPAPCPWDLDDDCGVRVTDFLILLAAWGSDPGGPPDFNGDGAVGVEDFLELLAHWGPCP